jgi:HAD superfamily hydrolase (TIGR01509 family)
MNKIKLILFDLDGVLIDTKWIHFSCLNEALGKYSISEEEHINIYDGRKTTQKLEMLTEYKGLPVDMYSEIYDKKQKLTMLEILKIQPRSYIVELFNKLQQDGYMIGVCSNSIRPTVLTALAKSGLMEYLSVIISNDDVKNPKPHPEMFWKAMSMQGCLPEETVVVEDSPQGLAAAFRSRAHVIRVSSPDDVTVDNIYSKLTGEQFVTKWKDENLNVLIPMAGAGSRFSQAGYTFPKPLIPVNGKPMIQVVVENLGVADANFIFVVQKEHREKFHLDTMLDLITPGKSTVIEVDGITEGAACTALLAKELIDNDKPLLFANSDQYVDWRPIDFMYKMQEQQADGGIVTFKDTHPKWSFAAVDLETNLVTEVAEKNPISDNATAGYYYWKHGADFVKYAERMIEKEIRVNNEFYVCPVYNQAIEDGKKVRVFEADGMWGLGTPEDLEYFLKEKK